MKDLIERLNQIAKKNGDEFGYKFDLELRRNGDLKWTFIVYETADGHTILAGEGFTPKSAAEDVELGIPAALEEWGYSE